MHVFIESAQRTPTRQTTSVTHKRCVHHSCYHGFHIAQCCTALCLLEFSEVQLLVNAFGMFQAFYCGNFSHDFRTQGVTLKSKALATNCIFQNYSQLLDIYILKTAEEVFAPSVYTLPYVHEAVNWN